MDEQVQYAEVVLWGRVIAVVAWDAQRGVGNFEYTPEFQRSGIQVAPLQMPLSPEIYSFPTLNRETYYGLPGLLSDCLPDKFGNLLINQWLVRSGRDVSSFSPIERLCYVGQRGMGALEFRPTLGQSPIATQELELDELVQLANQALQQKATLQVQMAEDDPSSEAMQAILSVGTSAGGARAKAVIAWNPETHELRSGQLPAPAGFEHWLLKFDGVAGNRDKELADPQGYGRVEYGYYLMALAAGVQMSDCRLYEENGRSHFMTRRFDRTEDGKKCMMQSLCALQHLDFNQPGAHSYEQAIQVAEQLQVAPDDMRELYRRMVFNVLARNQDDHTKNIAFLMDRRGQWQLSPAYDVTFSYNPSGMWTSQHQMSLNGKRTDFELDDLLAVAKRFRVIGKRRGPEIIEQVSQAVQDWPQFAEQAGVDDDWMHSIGQAHRVVG